MNISFSSYQVQKGDTLISVAEQLEITPEELRRYHNTYCDIKNLIEKDLRGIHEIIVPPSEVIKEFKDKHKKTSQYNSLPSVYLNEKFYAENYKCQEQITQNNQKNVEITYIISSEIVKNVETGFVANVACFNFKKKQIVPDDKMSMVSLACMESLYPISLSVPAQGAVKGFYNYKNLIQKFENKRSELEDFYIGEVYKNYFDKFYHSIKNEHYLLKQFQSALLYQILFPTLDWFHRKESWEDHFYVISDSFPVKCLFMVEYDFDNTQEVDIIIKGKMIEDCSLQELLRGTKFEEERENLLTGEIEIRYTTSKETKQLKTIKASIKLWHDDEIYHEHKLNIDAVKLVKKLRIALD